jgi:hypothetical protein
MYPVFKSYLLIEYESGHLDIFKTSNINNEAIKGVLVFQKVRLPKTLSESLESQVKVNIHHLSKRRRNGAFKFYLLIHYDSWHLKSKNSLVKNEAIHGVLKKCDWQQKIVSEILKTYHIK